MENLKKEYYLLEDFHITDNKILMLRSEKLKGNSLRIDKFQRWFWFALKIFK